jgi:glucosylglycerate synthase
MFVQVVSSVFDLMSTYERQWKAVAHPEEVPLFGFPHGVGVEPLTVDTGRMLSIFRQGSRDLPEIWGAALAPTTFDEVAALAASTAEPFRFPDPLWVRTVYDFATAYHRRIMPGDQLLRSMVPLYLGRTASFVIQTAASGPEDVERIIRGLADEYTRQKGYLVERWGSR